MQICTHMTLFSAIASPVTQAIVGFCAGGSHACAVFDAYKMKCWGSSFSTGQALSYGTAADRVGDNIPYFNPGANLSIIKATCSERGICILLNTGSIKCAGANSAGEAGQGVSNAVIAPTYVGDTLPIVNLGDGVIVTSIASGNVHHCISTAEGKVKCFGANSDGQLGYGDITYRGSSPSHMSENLPYVNLGVGVEVTSVYSGTSAYHNCAILSKPVGSEQRIKCWGRNYQAQLGYGGFFSVGIGDASSEMGDNLPLVDLGIESRVKQLAIGQLHTCALLFNDVLKCSGSGMSGNLGTGSTASVFSTGDSLPSILVDSGKSIKWITAGYSHTCISYDDMITMKCFGLNDKGQLGQGDTINRGNTPTTTIPSIIAIDFGTGLLQIKYIYSGTYFNCVVFVDSSVKCFGENASGQASIGKIASPQHRIGDEPSEMGVNLTFAILFSPAKPPTTSPTTSPTNSPTNPTLSPIKHPTSSPTRQCDYSSAKLCRYDPKCMWLKIDDINQCVVFDCTVLNKGKCGKERSRCKWNKKRKVCDFKQQSELSIRSNLSINDNY